jgi:hypothetical protein
MEAHGHVVNLSVINRLASGSDCGWYHCPPSSSPMMEAILSGIFVKEETGE